MPQPVEDATVAALRKALERASRRAAVTASNLANVDTPGYRALEMTFDDALAASGGVAPARTNPAHLSGPGGRGTDGAVREASATRMRNDGNTVDVDREMTLLAETQGRYQGAAEMVRKRFGLLIYAGTDGRSGG